MCRLQTHNSPIKPNFLRGSPRAAPDFCDAAARARILSPLPFVDEFLDDVFGAEVQISGCRKPVGCLDDLCLMLGSEGLDCVEISDGRLYGICGIFQEPIVLDEKAEYRTYPFELLAAVMGPTRHVERKSRITGASTSLSNVRRFESANARKVF